MYNKNTINACNTVPQKLIRVCISCYIYTVHVSSVTCATNANASCNSWFDAIKITPCSKTVSARQMRTFCFLCNEQEEISRQSNTKLTISSDLNTVYPTTCISQRK